MMGPDFETLHKLLSTGKISKDRRGLGYKFSSSSKGKTKTLHPKFARTSVEEKGSLVDALIGKRKKVMNVFTVGNHVINKVIFREPIFSGRLYMEDQKKVFTSIDGKMRGSSMTLETWGCFAEEKKRESLENVTSAKMK